MNNRIIAYQLEQKLHYVYKHCRMYGEYFSLSQNDVEDILEYFCMNDYINRIDNGIQNIQNELLINDNIERQELLLSGIDGLNLLIELHHPYENNDYFKELEELEPSPYQIYKQEFFKTMLS